MWIRSFILSVLYFIFVPLSGYADAKPQQPTGTFCKNGVFPNTGRPLPRIRFNKWGSFCAQGDDFTGSYLSAPLHVERSVTIFISGHPQSKNIQLGIENEKTKARLKLGVRYEPGTQWRLFRWELPEDWQNQDIRVFAEDNALGANGWIGVGIPPQTVPSLYYYKFLIVAFHALIISICGLLPGILAASFLRDRYSKSLSLASTIIVPSLLGFLSFWVYLLDPQIGTYLSYVLLICSLIGMIVCRRKILECLWDSSMRTPLVLLVLFVQFSLASGYLFHGTELMTEVPRFRYSHPLPNDNSIPIYFAWGLVSGKIIEPLSGDWLSSDRPPLQTGMITLWWPLTEFIPDLEYYEIVSIFMQSFWIVGFWILLCSCRISNVPIRLSLFAIATSPVVFVHTFYTWPKLLSAAFVLTATGLFYLASSRPESRRSLLIGAAISVGLSMLSHGAAIFGLVAMGGALLVMRLLPNFKLLLGVGLISIIIYIPWLGYQATHGPANRLFKWHLAGITEVDGRTTWQTIEDEYGKLDGSKIIEYKISNFRTIIGHLETFYIDSYSVLKGVATFRYEEIFAAASNIRNQQFFHLFPALGPFLLFGFLCIPFAYLKKNDSKDYCVAERRLMSFLLLACLFGLLFAGLVLFGPYAAVLHQGSHFIPFALTIIAVLAFCHISSILAYAFVIAHSLFHLCVYTFIPSTVYIADPNVLMDINGIDGLALGMLVLTFSLIGFLLLLKNQQSTNFS